MEVRMPVRRLIRLYVWLGLGANLVLCWRCWPAPPWRRRPVPVIW